MFLKNLFAALLLTGTLVAHAQGQSSAPALSGNPNLKTGLGALPLTFEQNRGQAASQVNFLARGRGYTSFLAADGMTIALQPAHTSLSRSNKSERTSQHIVQFKLVGSAQKPRVSGEDPQLGRVNYFIGNDPTKWQTNVQTYNKVRYKDVYPGIDVVYYGSNHRLEYDFELRPGADPSKIKLEIAGASQIVLDRQNNLVVDVGADQLVFACPAVYQVKSSARTVVQGRYTIIDSTHVGFGISDYDDSKPLVIDPVLIYSTYLGGSGDDESKGIVVDGSGNIYIAGYTDSADFPLAATGSVPSGSPHVFIAKLDPTGSHLIYADYIGGSGQDYGYALTLDPSNDVFIAGSTSSSDFPVINAYQATYPGSFNAFLSELSPDGSSLSYSTYLGGNGSDIPSGVAIDSVGEIVVAGYTSSTNFPVSNAYQATASPNGGGVYGNYGFVTKFTSNGSALVYSTYLGGSSNVPSNCGTPCWGQPTTIVDGTALDGSGNAYLAGITNTYDFPVTSGAYLTSDTTQQNALVSFVTKLSSSGGLTYSTYFYESSGLMTDIAAIAVDANGSAYVTGQAISDGTFPVTTTTICDPSVYGGSCSYAFVTKLDPTGATLSYSTFLGPNNFASPTAIVLDASNDAYVAAVTTSNTYSTVSGIEQYTAGDDLLLAELDPNGATQLWSTYFGGSMDEIPTGLAIDASGNLYVAGTTTSSDLPVTPGSFQGTYAGNTDSFVLKIGSGAAPSVVLNPQTLQFSAQAVASTSAAQSVTLSNMGSAALLISSISTAGDFAETDNCSPSVPAAGSCSISVTFTPATAGERNGTVVISDNAAGARHVIALSGTGMGPIASVSPTSLSFSAIAVGSSSVGQAITLSNTGNTTLSLGSIVASGDFSQTNTCGSSLAAASSCSISVTFVPSATGQRSGAISITDSAGGSPQTVILGGIGTVPLAVISPSSLKFSATPIDSSSATQTISVSNNGSTTLNIGGIQTAGDFSQTNTCKSSLPAGSSCSITAKFSPTASGNRSGTISISENAGSTTQTIQLSGTGLDFAISSSPTSVTVNSGSSATYNLVVSSVGGSFSNGVKFSCGTLPSDASCSFSRTSVTPGTGQVGSTLTISTGSANARLLTSPQDRSSVLVASLFPFSGIGLFGAFFTTGTKDKRKLRILLLLATMMFLLLLSGCAGGTGIAPQGGTPSGTYNVTVTGTSGTLQHNVSLKLIVQ